MKKNQNNKGFSLVELIVVVAIMGVLMVVLAPALLRYVERARLQTDNSMIAEIANAIEIALTDEDVINAIPAAGVTIPFADTSSTDGTQTYSWPAAASRTAFHNELIATLGDAGFSTTSTTYRNAGDNITINVTITSGVATITVDNYWPATDATGDEDGVRF